MACVELVGGPIPYREALAARLVDGGHHLAESFDGTSLVQADVSVVYGEDEVSWIDATERVTAGLTVVIVLAEMAPTLYARALSAGAGVVYVDTSTEIMVAVIEAALQSEVLVPTAVARLLVQKWQPETSLGELSTDERQLADAILSGRTIQDIADEMAYSDRTVRRRLQGLYLKLGVGNRPAAIAALSVGLR